MLIASRPRVCARSEPVVSDSCSTSAGCEAMSNRPNPFKSTGNEQLYLSILSFLRDIQQPSPYRPPQFPPITLPGFSLGSLWDTAALVEHVFETTGSNRAQTRAVSQREPRENPTQHSYSSSSFKARAHQALPRKQ